MKNPAVRIITGILAFILSIPFVLTAFSTCIVYTLDNSVKPESLSELIKELAKSYLVESTEVLPKSPSPTASATPMAGEIIVGGADIDENILRMIFGDSVDEIDQELVNDILESKAAQEIIDVVADEVSGVILGVGETGNLSSALIKNIATENMDEILDIVEKHAPVPINRQELSSNIITAIDENGGQIDSIVQGTTKAVNNVDPAILDLVRSALGKGVLIILVVICAVLALLICLCRLYRFGSFTWLGSNLLSVSFMLFAVCYASPMATQFLSKSEKLSGSAVDTINNILSVFTSTLQSTATAVAIAGAVLFATGIILKIAIPKKKAIKV